MIIIFSFLTIATARALTKKIVSYANQEALNVFDGILFIFVFFIVNAIYGIEGLGDFTMYEYFLIACMSIGGFIYNISKIFKSIHKMSIRDHL
jgi:hypothetical protein